MPNGKDISFQLRHDPPPADPFHQFLIWLTSADTGSGLTLTFGPRGWALPMHLLAGQTLTAIPDQADPATNNRMHAFYSIGNFERIRVRPELPLDQENGTLTAPCLKTSLVVKDDGLGTSLASFDIWLLPGFGVIRSAGQVAGVPTVLDLIEFYISS